MFVHLRLHSEFSIVDGTCRIDSTVGLAAKDGQPAMALTDLNNLFGAIKFYKAARGAGIKPLIGVDAWIDGLGAPGASPVRVLLLVQNHQGYLNLCEHLSRAHTNSSHRMQAPAIPVADLMARNDGLLLLSGAQGGPIGQALLQGDEARARDLALQLAGAFAQRFYLEVQRAGRPDDEAHVLATARLAARLGLPLVATHPIQFESPEAYDAHEARSCIAEGEILANPRRTRRFTREQCFKSTAEMQVLFADLPSALANTVEIARRCSLTLDLGKPRLPDFPTPDGSPLEAYFRSASRRGLDERLVHLYPDSVRREAERPRYEQRLVFEMDTIVAMGFPGYFLIVGDFIQWAKANGCPVGPGRGSGAGSLVAYSLGITDLDPLQYQLLFERFLNPDRVSMPDFDIDFCQGNRDRVIEYVKGKYGKDAVSQIATFGSMAARAAIRDVGRVLDMSYTFCDGISKLIPNKPGTHITIADALQQEPQLAERHAREDEVRTLLAYAQQIEGLTRNVGMHAGGVLIAPGKLTDFCPLYQQPGGDALISQYDKDDVEAAGLVKFDFLGLATLTILEFARKMIRRRHPSKADFDFAQVPLDDAETYRVFAEARTEAVFQFESRGMQAMLRDAKPTRLEDLIALNALFRPGPMDLIPTFIARKHGRQEVEYPHPLVEPVLSETYGIMVYQEQVMQVAQILGGYSLGGADLLRRAMGKKKPEEMAKHREIFRAGAAKNGIDAAKADEIFDLMEKFAGYGFNKSHAAAYSLLAYHTGWLKAHHTVEFYCANMSVEMDNTDKLKALVEDALRHGVQFEPPDINRGLHDFEPVSERMVRYGLGAVKGTGRQAIDAIVRERDAGGTYRSLYDFCARVDRQRVNKRSVEALIKAGAFDGLQRNRAALIASVDRAFDYAAAQEAHVNQGGLFDGDGDASHGSARVEPPLVEASAWGIKETLSHEKLALGFYLSGHLFDEVEREVRQFVKRRIDEAVESREAVLLAGIVSELRFINVSRGRLALFRLDDKTLTVDASADESVWQLHRHTLKDDEVVVVSARVQQDRMTGGVRLAVQQVWDLPAARCRFGQYFKVLVNGRAPDVQRLMNEFPAQRESTEHGDTLRGLRVRLALLRPGAGPGQGAKADLLLGEDMRFYPTDLALRAWRAQADQGQAAVVYE